MTDGDGLVPEAFEWHEQKRRTNLEKHGIDFEDAARMFDGPVLRIPSDRHGEKRWRAIGQLEGRLICVVYTERSNVYRIISARRARHEEEAAYRALYP